MEGGNIALVENDDTIFIDITNRILEVKVSSEELAQRKANRKMPLPKVTSGYLARYARMVTSASTGAVLK